MASALLGSEITIVGINYAPELTGIGPYTTFLAEQLAGRGARVRVITGIPHYPSWKASEEYRRGLRWEENRNGVEVIRRRHFVPASADLKGRALMELSFTAVAAKEVLRRPGDAIIAVTPSLAGLVAAVAAHRGRPLGVIVQDLTGEGASQSGTTGSRVGRSIASVEYGLLRRADLVGVITPGFGDALAAEGVDRSRVVATPNFSRVVASSATTNEARCALGWPTGTTTVVHAGNMGMKQGLEVVIDAARLRPSMRFLLIGAGNQRLALERHGRGVSNVEFHDPYSDERFPLVLAAADVLLLSERAGVVNMSMPSKLTSYVAAGRPIVAAVTAGGLSAAEVDRLGVALRVEPSNPIALCEGIDRVLSNEELSQRLTRAQSVAVEELQPAAAVETYIAFAEQLLAMSKSR